MIGPRSHRNRRLSRRGASFIARFEGFRSLPYNDPAGHATIGFGHLIHTGPVTQGDLNQWGHISRRRGLNLLREDARGAEQAVNEKVSVKLAQHEFDMLVSFTFNLGTGALAEATLLRKLNQGNYASVPGEMARWVFAGGVKLPGLERRRAAEGRRFRHRWSTATL